MGKDTGPVDEVRGALNVLDGACNAPDPDERIMSARILAVLAETQASFPFEEVMAGLRTRWPPAPGCERDGRVRKELFTATRHIGVWRARREGLLVPRPPEPGALQPSQLHWLVIERVWDAATIYEGRAVLRSILDLATPGQQGLYGVWWTLSEVNNGGFSQYFHNSTCVVAPEALSGFRAIGAEAHASALARVLEAFGNPPSDDHDERVGLLEGEVLDLLQDSSEFFFAAHGLEDVHALAAAYVLAHPEEFFRP